MDNTLQLEQEIANLDEQINSQVRMMSDKLAAPHKIEDIEGDALVLTSLIELRKQRASSLEKAREGRRE